MIHDLSASNSIVNLYISQMRDVNIQTQRLLFRHNMERLGNIFAYEVSKYLTYESKEIETPLGIANMSVPTGRVILCTILRAGLPLHYGILNFLDFADNAFIAAYRKNHKDGTFEINLEYVTCPNLEGATLILVDPMLATGASLDTAIHALEEYGKFSALHIVTAIASSHGVSYIKRLYPQAHLWIGAQDDELTAKSYIVPGLGDAGDLSFGAKLQE
jgi:uracil phosphoribosyltransferase